MNTNQKHKGILSLISLSIYMNDIHEHPLLFCSPLDRKQYGNSWSCNKCKSTYNYKTSSFYCTFCDFDLCTKCLGFCQLNQISIYKDDNKFTTNNLNNNNTSFQWQKRIHKHEHFLTLIEKLNKNYNWKCEFCLKEYNNKSGLFRQISQKFELIREETSWTVEVPTAHQRAEVCGYHTVDRVIVSA